MMSYLDVDVLRQAIQEEYAEGPTTTTRFSRPEIVLPCAGVRPT
jgi:hypothetical protein